MMLLNQNSRIALVLYVLAHSTIVTPSWAEGLPKSLSDYARIAGEAGAARSDCGLDLDFAAPRKLGCRGTSRSDFRWDESRGVDGLYLLEVNTQPGMTPLSLVPEQGRYKGMSYAELVQRIVDEAL